MNGDDFGDVETQSPIVTYTNRLQKQMHYVTFLLFDQRVTTSRLKDPIIGIIANLPPEAKEVFKNELLMLQSKTSDLSVKQISEIYMRVHDWTYKTMFKDAFTAKPKWKPGKL